jgi:DNA-directed RNA polymerase subunit RPC12/RpoP
MNYFDARDAIIAYAYVQDGYSSQFSQARRVGVAVDVDGCLVAVSDTGCWRLWPYTAADIGSEHFGLFAWEEVQVRRVNVNADRDSILKAATELRDCDMYGGVCACCGHIEESDIEPDARGRECPACGAKALYGAEEMILMLTV